MHKPRYCLFYDNHTMGACPDMGTHFDVEGFIDRIQACGVDYLTFHARCNQGFAYYDTAIGIKHPSLNYDLFGKLAEVCQQKGIALTAYFNGGLSHEEGKLHRDWVKLGFDGREYKEKRLSAYVRSMCYNSPYRNHLISMVKEVAEKYTVSGFFVDCLTALPCICPICIKEMKERGIDWNNREKVVAFAESSAIRLSKDIADAAKAINPDYLLNFNNPPFDQLADISTYFECECLPTSCWGYDYLPNMSHFLRTIRPDFPILNMTGRFNEWGDFGGLRTEAGLEYDLFYGLANGMRPNIGSHFHPRGDIIQPVFDRIKSVYQKLQKYDTWFDDAKNVVDIGVVYPKHTENIMWDSVISGTVRMLSELKCQFNIVTECSDWSNYSILILPDNVTFNDEVAKRMQSHIAAGKAIIASGESGLNPEKTGFVLEQEWGISYNEKLELDPIYFEHPESFAEGLPDMPLSTYAGGTDVTPVPGTLVKSRLIKPYYNRHWDGENAFTYTPPEKVIDSPFLTRNKNIAYFSCHIFEGYYNQAPYHLRQLVANVLAELHPNPILKTENLPSFAKAFVTEQPGRKMVHLLSYVPELRGKTQAIDEPATVADAKIALRMDGTKTVKAFLAPDCKELQAEFNNDYATVEVPLFKGYCMIVFENIQ